MAIFFTADTHFGHESVIKHCKRPFATLDEMNTALLLNWNSRVKNKDDIYIVGDFCYRGRMDDVLQILKQLNGRKHLIAGNHDKKYLKNEAFRNEFVSVVDILNLAVNGERMVLCHYPMAEWDGYFRGAWHIYGHIHNKQGETFELMRSRKRGLNAGSDITNFYPVTFEELKQYNDIFNTQALHD